MLTIFPKLYLACIVIWHWPPRYLKVKVNEAEWKKEREERKHGCLFYFIFFIWKNVCVMSWCSKNVNSGSANLIDPTDDR